MIVTSEPLLAWNPPPPWYQMVDGVAEKFPLKIQLVISTAHPLKDAPPPSINATLASLWASMQLAKTSPVPAAPADRPQPSALYRPFEITSPSSVTSVAVISATRRAASPSSTAGYRAASRSTSVAMPFVRPP